MEDQEDKDFAESLLLNMDAKPVGRMTVRQNLEDFPEINFDDDKFVS